MKSMFLATYVVLFAFVGSPALAEPDESLIEGPGHAGGGNGIVAEFQRMAEYFADEFLTLQFNEANIDKEKLKLAVANMKVSSPGELVLRGQKVDAINYPLELRIELDDQTLSKKNTLNRYQIVIHELLGLMMVKDELDGQAYKLSEVLADRTFPQNGNFLSLKNLDCDQLNAKWGQLNRRFNYDCFDNEDADLKFCKIIDAKGIEVDAELTKRCRVRGDR